MNIKELEDEYLRMVSPLPVHACYKQLNTYPQHDGSPHIEVVGENFDYVITERGAEYERRKGLSADEVLYLLMESATMEVAMKYELNNRVEGKDSRAVWFPYQVSLMGELKPEWGTRLAAEHVLILKEHPFTS